ncbi:Adapter molecule Crk [Chionoecetes opilio]|uniref:Adapter molecule Crk n=1 Tax=Chionoecetes opilio TaxID=41210 RepID=A0A8J5CGT0_CHIOP|nr:Adapter molecule Crk [Chionoecetes opilio]
MVTDLKFVASSFSPLSSCLFPDPVSPLQDPDDLPFRRGEILTIVHKDEEKWWTARNSTNQIGSIPVPYVQKNGHVMHVLLTGMHSISARRAQLMHHHCKASQAVSKDSTTL